MSASKKGRVRSPEECAKHRGKRKRPLNISPEGRERLRTRLGKPLTAEHKAKLKEGRKRAAVKRIAAAFGGKVTFGKGYKFTVSFRAAA